MILGNSGYARADYTAMFDARPFLASGTSALDSRYPMGRVRSLTARLKALRPRATCVQVGHGSSDIIVSRLTEAWSEGARQR
jgi:hypothetical protein